MGGYLLLGSFLFCGVAAADAFARKKCALIRIWLGLVLGLILMMWTPALAAFAMGFTVKAQLTGLACALVFALCAQFFARKIKREKQPFCGTLSPALLAALVLPLFLFSCYLLGSHYLRPAADGSLHVGQSTYGDLSLHLGIATSLRNASFPPDYSILKGTLLGYPFLADSMVTSMLLFGTGLRAAFLGTGCLMMLLTYTGFVIFAWEMTQKKAAVVLAFVLLFFNGGLGFCYVFDGAMHDPTALKEVFTGFYCAPTNMVDLNIRWVNLLCDMFIPQRTFLAGWTVLIPALWMLVNAMKTRTMKAFVLLGLWAGTMPMIHTHSFLALGLLSAGCLLHTILRDRSNIRRFAVYGIIAVLLALPQLLLWSVPQTVEGGSLHLRFNWSNNNNGALVDEYFWFWIKNVGPVYLLLVPAALAAGKSSPMRALSLGALIIYILAECIQFQPNPYDNNKLFYAAYLAMMPCVAAYLCTVWTHLSGIRGRAFLAAVFLFVCTVSAVLSMAREAVSDYTLFSADDVNAATFIEENTSEKCTVLTGDQHNNAVAALTGRYIVCGTGSYLYFHGLDYTDQYIAEKAMFENPADSAGLFASYGVDYVFISHYERSKFNVDELWFSQNAQLVYQNNTIDIYALSTRALNEMSVKP